jgi:YegS/Rv2252/BmrU family lipid kinase
MRPEPADRTAHFHPLGYDTAVADRTLIIVNPRSRGGRTGRLWPDLERRLRGILGRFDWEPTGAVRDAERIAAEAARAGVERIVVAGGDGTVSEVVTGLMASGLAGQVELGVLPLGTGGDFARGLGIPRDPGAAARQLAGAKPRPIDAGRVRYVGRDGAATESFFVNTATYGISGLVVDLVERATAKVPGPLAFLIGTLRALAQYRVQPVRIAVDGEVFFEGPLVLATASNGEWFGGGMHLAPRARIDDGLLDVVVVPEMPVPSLVRRLPRLYRGTHLEVEGVSFRQGRVVEVEPLAGDVPIEVDGEPLGRVPLRVEVVPGAIKLLGPHP